MVFIVLLCKGVFFSESAIRFSNLPIPKKKKIFQKTILSLKFEFVVYYYWREISILSSGYTVEGEQKKSTQTFSSLEAIS